MGGNINWRQKKMAFARKVLRCSTFLLCPRSFPFTSSSFSCPPLPPLLLATSYLYQTLRWRMRPLLLKGISYSSISYKGEMNSVVFLLTTYFNLVESQVLVPIRSHYVYYLFVFGIQTVYYIIIVCSCILHNTSFNKVNVFDKIQLHTIL